MPIKNDRLNITGKRFHMLTALEYSGQNSHGHSIWECKCDCGKIVGIRLNSLNSGNSKSCGCAALKFVRKRDTDGICKKHQSTHNSWRNMVRRCYNSKIKNFHLWGGGGIIVCDRWLYSFKNFLEDMGERPSGTSLDRHPNNCGNYEPGNCRWATAKEQRANRRNPDR